MKKRTVKTILTYLIPCVVFSLMIVWFVSALTNTSKSNEKRELEALKANIENGITICYSIEGAYPQSIEYLCENYGLIYDKSRYIISYDGFASNIRPTVTVFERRGISEKL